MRERSKAPRGTQWVVSRPNWDQASVGMTNAGLVRRRIHRPWFSVQQSDPDSLGTSIDHRIQVDPLQVSVVMPGGDALLPVPMKPIGATPTASQTRHIEKTRVSPGSRRCPVRKSNHRRDVCRIGMDIPDINSRVHGFRARKLHDRRRLDPPSFGLASFRPHRRIPSPVPAPRAETVARPWHGQGQRPPVALARGRHRQWPHG